MKRGNITGKRQSLVQAGKYDVWIMAMGL